MTAAFSTVSAAVSDVAISISSAHAAAIAKVFLRHHAPSEVAMREIVDAVPHENVRQIARRLANTWIATWNDGQDGVEGQAVSLALRSAADAVAAVRGQQSVEVVWSGPSTTAVPVRLTPAVIAQLAAECMRVLWVVSFAAYKVPDIVAALAEAAERGVDVRLVLETKDDSNGALSFDASTAFNKIKDRVSIYTWPHDQRGMADGKLGAMHAKAVIADGTAAFVTSANLTGSAMTGNMELGLLARGGATPDRLARHFQALVDQGVLQRVGQLA